MINYNPSTSSLKTSAKVIQLVLTGMEDTSTKSAKQLKDTPDSCITPRVLKVVEIGDFWAKRTMPSIRLQGKWMLHAGVLPNHHVQVTNPSPGILMIQLLKNSFKPTQT